MHFVCFRDEKINNLEEQMSSLKDEATRMETERTNLLAKVRYFTLIFTEVITERTDLLAKVRYFTLIFTEVITERTDLLAKVRYFTSGIIEDLTESDKKTNNISTTLQILVHAFFNFFFKDYLLKICKSSPLKPLSQIKPTKGKFTIWKEKLTLSQI